jgi:hypothetical protein
MESFAYALDRWVECANDELVTKQNLFVDLAQKTLACLENEMPRDEWRRSEAPSQCQKVDVDIDFYHFLDGYEVAPLCIKEPRFFPRGRWDLERCSTEVAEHARNTKRMVEEGAWELRSKARRAADAAINKFNCHARRDQFCF